MGLGPSLSIRQSQQLVLTPQLTQAIKLLQLSNLELEAFIAEEIAKNPLLEGRTDEPDEQPAGDFMADEDGGSDEAPDDPGADNLIMGQAKDDRPLDRLTQEQLCEPAAGVGPVGELVDLGHCDTLSRQAEDA